MTPLVDSKIKKQNHYQTLTVNHKLTSQIPVAELLCQDEDDGVVAVLSARVDGYG